MSLGEQLQQLHALEVPYADAFDDRVLIQLLLCIAAGERNLVLRVGAEGQILSAQQRKEWAQRVGAEVAWICSTLFALSTHRVQCTTKASTTTFLRSLFLPPPSSLQAPLSRSDLGSRKESAVKPGNSAVSAVKRTDSKTLQRRSVSAPLGIIVPPPGDSDKLDNKRSRLSPGMAYTSPTRRQQNTSDSVLGSPTYLTADPLSYDPVDDPQDSSAGEDLYPTRSLSPRQPSPDRRKAGRPPSPERRRSGTRRHTVNALGPGKKSEAGLVGLGLGGSRTPPLGVSRELGVRKTPEALRTIPSAPRSPTPRGGPTSPTAISLFTPHIPPSAPFDRRPSIASVQSALSTPPIPTPQIVRSPPPPTSTSPTSPSFLSQPPTSPTTPSISSRRHSAEIGRSSAPPPVRSLPQVLILERLERTRPSVQQSLLDMLRERRISLSSNSSSVRRAVPTVDDGSSMRTRRTEMTIATTAEGWEGTYNLPTGFLCVAIVCGREAEEDEDDGAWGGVSRHLFDRFSLSHTIPSTAFLRPYTFDAPSPSPSHPLATSPPLSATPLPPRSLPADISPALQTYASDLLSTLRHHPLLEGRMLTARATIELALFTKIWVVLSRGGGGQQKKWEDDSMLLPRDVVNVLMGVVGHRLKLREARDEKSLFWGSEVGALEWNETREKGVEGVIRAVIKEV
ncbi:hypothetical protein BCR35DRAFT_311142 [Leucosporidium creatinivorum]|uniref:Uncharacterized protein n=1 Tax=Leucosporidium creatinivorum TaxID=106004 RepID=A0A1Y2CCV6_9BASI|nr:hypothetical protein BCR35DRAFT_311142 [Leucosporidium creatinivorum]